MAISRQKKKSLIEQYKEQIEQSSAIVFTDYRGTTVPQIQSLRTKLQENDTAYLVIKNTLFGVALQEAGRTPPEELLAGPNAVALVGEDIGKGVTALKDWIKAERIVEIKGALLENEVLDAVRAESLSDLPTKEQVLASVLGVLNAPASNLARMLNAPTASLVRVINAHVQQQQEAAG